MNPHPSIVATHNHSSIHRPTEDEVDGYRALLASAGLPPDGLADLRDTALVAVEGRALVGGAALEVYGEAALLRSVVVASAARGAGLGGRLVDAVVALAAERGVRTLYLLTESAAPFFARRGFAAVDRAAVPATVQQSIQFRAVCPQSASVLTADVQALRSRFSNESEV